jgi:hypothetical protein
MDLDAHTLQVIFNAPQKAVASQWIASVIGTLMEHVLTTSRTTRTRDAALMPLQERQSTMDILANLLTTTCNVLAVDVFSQWTALVHGNSMTPVHMTRVPTRTRDADCTRLQWLLPTTGMPVYTPMLLSSALLSNVLSQWTALDHGATMIPASMMVPTMQIRSAGCTMLM